MQTGKILGLILVLSVMAYGIHLFFKKKIDPRRAFGFFMLYILVHLLTVFVLVFIFSFLLNTYKEFFFKR